MNKKDREFVVFILRLLHKGMRVQDVRAVTMSTQRKEANKELAIQIYLLKP